LGSRFATLPRGIQAKVCDQSVRVVFGVDVFPLLLIPEEKGLFVCNSLGGIPSIFHQYSIN